MPILPFCGPEILKLEQPLELVLAFPLNLTHLHGLTRNTWLSQNFGLKNEKCRTDIQYFWNERHEESALFECKVNRVAHEMSVCQLSKSEADDSRLCVQLRARKPKIAFWFSSLTWVWSYNKICSRCANSCLHFGSTLGASGFDWLYRSRGAWRICGRARSFIHIRFWFKGHGGTFGNSWKRTEQNNFFFSSQWSTQV